MKRGGGGRKRKGKESCLVVLSRGQREHPAKILAVARRVWRGGVSAAEKRKKEEDLKGKG